MKELRKDMHIKRKGKLNNNEYGQALLFVVVAVTIALSVGVSVATRTLSSQKRVASSDSATRVASAAEGGAEAALGKTYSILASLTNLSSLTDQNCKDYGFTKIENNKCVLTYPSAVGDSIVTKATVSVLGFSMNAPDNYWFNLNPGMVKEIYLVSYAFNKVDVCWENKDAAIYTLSYDNSGGIKKGWFVKTGFSSLGDTDSFATASQNIGSPYGLCARVSLVSNTSYGLRIKTLYASTRVHVYPVAPGIIPQQGYKITSVGEIVSGGSEESRIVVVYKSYPYAASIIDAGLYSATGDIN